MAKRDIAFAESAALAKANTDKMIPVFPISYYFFSGINLLYATYSRQVGQVDQRQHQSLVFLEKYYFYTDAEHTGTCPCPRYTLVF
jgi:hypothetical protein